MEPPPPRPALPPAQGPMPLPPMQGPPVAPPPSVMAQMPGMGFVSQIPPTMAGNVPVPFADGTARTHVPMGVIPPSAADPAVAMPAPGQNMRDLEYQALLAAASVAAPPAGPRQMPVTSVADSAALTQRIITPPGIVPPDVAAGPGPMPAPTGPGAGGPPTSAALALNRGLAARGSGSPDAAPMRQDASGAPRPPARDLDAALPQQQGDVNPYARSPGVQPVDGAPVPTSPAEPPSTTAARGVVRDAAPSTPPAGTPRGQAPTVADYPPNTVRRVADSAVQHWMETGLPQMQQFYLQTGQIEKLTALNEWAEAEKTREGMRAWGQAVFAAELGDFEGFKSAISRAYNTLDYFGDGMTIVEDKSDFIRDGDAIVGARVTFRDEATGREIVQEFSGPGDLLMQGINMLAPEQAFEYRLKQIEAQAAAVAERQQAIFKAQLDAGTAPPMAKRISDAIAEKSKTDLAFAQLPMDQQIATAVEFIRLLDQAAAGGPPGAIPPGSTPTGPAAAPPLW